MAVAEASVLLDGVFVCLFGFTTHADSPATMTTTTSLYSYLQRQLESCQQHVNIMEAILLQLRFTGAKVTPDSAGDSWLARPYYVPLASPNALPGLPKPLRYGRDAALGSANSESGQGLGRDHLHGGEGVRQHVN